MAKIQRHESPTLNPVKSESSRILPISAKASSLSNLAEKINASYQLAQRRAFEWIEAVRTCGDYLLKAKVQVGHGNWGRWLSTHTSLSQDTAENWMKIARNWCWLCLEAYHMGKPSVDRLLNAIKTRKAMSPRQRAFMQIQQKIVSACSEWEDAHLSVFSDNVEEAMQLLQSQIIEGRLESELDWED